MSEQFSGTKEVSEKLAFNLEDLNIYLEKKDINIGNILNYEQFKGGQSNPTYLLTSENNKVRSKVHSLQFNVLMEKRTERQNRLIKLKII